MRRIIPGAAAALLLALLLASSLVHVPKGQLGATSSGWIGEGWKLKRPFARTALVPATGTVLLPAVATRTPGGATGELSVTLTYILDPAGGPELARRIAAEGFAPALTAAISPVSDNTSANATSGPRRRQGGVGDPLGAALAQRIRGAGVEVVAIAWRRTDQPSLPPPTPLATRRRVLLIGLDAADWQIIDPLLAAGKMPNVARLLRHGARASLRSYDPMMSPLIWTTIVTGAGPDVHGIADFLITDETTGKPVPITSRYRKVKALWNILSDARLESGFAGWWASYPADPVQGFLVTDLLNFSLNRRIAEPAPGLTWPADYYDALKGKMILPDAVGYEEVAGILHVSREQFASARDVKLPEHPEPGVPPVGQDPVWQVRKVIAATRNFETVGLDLLGKNLDLVGVYFEGIDLMGHRFQHCMPPRMSLCDEASFAQDKDAVTAFYEYQDGVLGHLLDAAGDRTVVVVSDHGFRSGADRPTEGLPYTTGQPVEWHRESGILIVSGPGAKTGAVIRGASVYDIAPTLLALCGMPAADDMQGRVLSEALDPAAVPGAALRRIGSYEDAGPARVLAEVGSSPEAQAEMVESLQALGYVGPLGGTDTASATAPTGAPGTAAGKPAEGDASRSKPATERSSGGSGSAGSARVTYHRNLATFYMKAGRLDEAEAELHAANLLFPLPKSYEMLSEIRAVKGDIDGAVANLEQGLRRFPEMDQDAVLWIVDLRIGAGQLPQAEAAAAAWRSRVARPALLATIDGKLAEARGDGDRAVALYLQALAAEPNLVQAALAAAGPLDARGRLAELEAPILKALAGERRIDAYQHLLGVIRLRQRRTTEALEAIDRALDVDPVNGRYLESFASAALAANRPEDALARYAAAVNNPKAGASVWSGYGRLLGRTRRPEEASAAFARAMALGDRSAPVYAGYATSLHESGQNERAAAVLREGLAAHPGEPALLAIARSFHILE